jgi:hypothetical protein
MADSNFPFIVVELFLVLGGALAFGWWQMRDLKKERLRTQLREQQALELHRSNAAIEQTDLPRTSDI